MANQSSIEALELIRSDGRLFGHVCVPADTRLVQVAKRIFELQKDGKLHQVKVVQGHGVIVAATKEAP